MPMSVRISLVLIKNCVIILKDLDTKLCLNALLGKKLSNLQAVLLDKSDKIC